ncbi:hypothetical protein Bbelb_282500 [Branchiostoma belcheri]|nr:hypothetical protein Bbelb_282500 [Branchiostoma belcheri]
MTAFTHNLDLTLESVHKEYSMCCVLGDFNMPRVDWDNCVVTNEGKEADFCNMINNHFLKQINQVPSNSRHNLLDLVFTDFPDRFSTINELPAEFDTDHTLLEFSLHCRVQPKHGLPRKVFNFKRADWNGLNTHLESLDLSEAVTCHHDIDSAWEAWSSALQSAVDMFVPCRKLKTSTSPPWIDSEVRDLQNRKRTAWRKAKRTDSSSHWAKFRKLRNKLKNQVFTGCRSPQ